MKKGHKKPIIAALAAATLLLSACGGPNGKLNAEDVSTLLTANRETWYTADTAGINLVDLDFDGLPELIATDAPLVWYDELDAYYFGSSHVRIYAFDGEAIKSVGEYDTTEYCFLATLHLYTTGSGEKGWYYTSDGEVWYLTLGDGAVTTTKATEMPDISGGDEAVPLLNNEAWISAGGAADQTKVDSDITAVTEAYFGEVN